MFNPDYKDLLRLFNGRGVYYIVVGAYAMAAHGVVRATGDIDLLVRPTDENASAVYDALVDFVPLPPRSLAACGPPVAPTCGFARP